VKLYKQELEVSRLFLELMEDGRRKKAKIVCSDFKVNALSPGEIGEKQFFMLFGVACLGINTITELADYLNQSTGSTSITMSKLAEAGYLEKHRPAEAEDKRRVYYITTRKGMDLLVKTLNGFVDAIKFAMNDIGKEKKAYFIKGYDALRQVISHFPGLEGISRYRCNFFTESYSKNTDGRNAAEIITDTIVFFCWFKSRYEKAVLKEKGIELTMNKARILGLVQYKGVDSIKDMADYAVLSDSALSATLSKLVDDGYMERIHPQIGDKRTVRFMITPQGEKIIHDVMEALNAMFTSYYNKLGGDVKELTYSGLYELHKAFK